MPTQPTLSHERVAGENSRAKRRTAVSLAPLNALSPHAYGPTSYMFLSHALLPLAALPEFDIPALTRHASFSLVLTPLALTPR